MKCIFLFSLNQWFLNFLSMVFFVLPIFGISRLTFLAIFCGMFFEFTLKTPKKIPNFFWLHGWNLQKEKTFLHTPLKIVSVECQEMGWTIEMREAQWTWALQRQLVNIVLAFCWVHQTWSYEYCEEVWLLKNIGEWWKVEIIIYCEEFLLFVSS